MSEVTLQVELRSEKGHQGAKELRKKERLPGIFYAHGENPVLLSVNFKDLQKLLQKEVNILDVVFPDGTAKMSILKEIQRDPVTDAPIHVDIMGIKKGEKIRITIPIVFKGTPIGVREGGILEHSLREVEVEGLPLDIPDRLEVDVSALKIGDGIILESLIMEKYKFITDLHHPVAHVSLPKVAKTVVETGEEAAVETEVAEEDKGE
jgi:large subunit ribosomal protein L25